MKKTIILAFLVLIALVGFRSAATVFALDCTQQNLSTQDAIQCGTNGASGNDQTSDQATTNIGDTAASVINILSAVVGVIAVIMIIIAGLRFVTSAGNAETAKAARSTITYAVVGLIIVALAQIIVHFVLNKVEPTTSNNPSPTTPLTPGGHI